MKTTSTTITGYNNSQKEIQKNICDCLEENINKVLKKNESKIWHGTPVWFIDGNPIVAYSVRKDGRVSLMFFSGQSFEESDLKPEGKFRAAEIFYTNVHEINIIQLKVWLEKSEKIQWDYKNIIKNKGKLNLLTL